jgi:transcriptional regulator with XRE-family HTH domain
MLSTPVSMPLKTEVLRSLIDPLLHAHPPKSQNAVARDLGIEPSALSRWLAGGGASYPQVARVARILGVEPSSLWGGKVPRRYAKAYPDSVSRGTAGMVREAQSVYGATLSERDLRGALWALEQMSLALADISRRARQATE